MEKEGPIEIAVEKEVKRPERETKKDRWSAREIRGTKE